MAAKAPRIIFGLLLGVAGISGSAANAPSLPEVIVVSDVSKVGEQARIPDSAHPVYYMALHASRPEKGPASAMTEQIPKEEVFGRLMAALAKRHYLLMTPAHPPELVLTFEWGSVKPEVEYAGSDDPLDENFTNEAGMVALVGANRHLELMAWHRRDLRDAAREARHYVIVTAYDYAAAAQKQKKILWITRMSLPSSGTDLATAIPALVTAGATAFGRQVEPDWIDSRKVQDEHVILAPLEVKGVVQSKK